jgi:VIT1/CCC1 family predicted Fe2+/Mn2+ transporter
VAAAHASHASIMTTAIAGLVAGAMSMAAGDSYRSIHKLIRRRRIWRGNVMN